MAGDDYTIADMAIWPWYGRLALGDAYEAGEFLSVHEYPHVIAWAERSSNAPAVTARPHGEPHLRRRPERQLWERHDASDFDTRTQDKVKAAE